MPHTVGKNNPNKISLKFCQTKRDLLDLMDLSKRSWRIILERERDRTHI
jgi:hypothetical protein